MDFVRQIFAADQWLWFVWLTALIGTGFIGRQLLARMRLRKVRRLHSDDSGAAYTMGVVLTLPLFLLLCGIAFEVTFLIIAKIGTVYAAYAGARATAVWHTMPGELEKQRVDQAVVSAMAPFAASLGFDPAANDPPADLPPYARDLAKDHFLAVQKSAGSEQLDQTKMQDHFLRVFRRIYSRSTMTNRLHGSEFVVSVEYAAPLIVPGVARFLDDDLKSPWQYTLRSEIRMTLEAPISRDGTLGIDYLPF